jgi:hypothetical protein
MKSVVGKAKESYAQRCPRHWLLLSINAGKARVPAKSCPMHGKGQGSLQLRVSKAWLLLSVNAGKARGTSGPRCPSMVGLVNAWERKGDLPAHGVQDMAGLVNAWGR